jgi:hypothetical protein
VTTVDDKPPRKREKIVTPFFVTQDLSAERIAWIPFDVKTTASAAPLSIER